MLSQFISQKFKFWAFVSMVLLVFVHGYNLDQRYLQPWTTPGEPMTPTGFLEYFLANGIFRFRIPMLFIISGFLYASHDQVPNKDRIGKRLRTLLVPYLIWSAVGIGLTLLLELTPYGRQLVEGSQVMQIDENRTLLHDYHWYELLFRWIVLPVSYQLWFIRVLLIYNLAYPAIRSCVMNSTGRWIFFSIVFLMWLGTMGFVLFEGEGLLFFSLGVWIQKTRFSIEIPKKWSRPMIWGFIFVGIALIKTWLAFNGEAIMGDSVYPVITILHKLVVIAGLITCWFGLDALVLWCMSRAWFVWLSSFSFIIYALHAPLVAILIDGSFEWLGYISGYRMIAFVLLPPAIIAGCIALGSLLRNFTPKVYSLLTGGRGI